MKRLIGLIAVCFILFGGGSAVLAQTATPTATDTPTNTPTNTDTPTNTPTNTPDFDQYGGVFKDANGDALRTCASTPCASDWITMDDLAGIFQFEQIAVGAITWTVTCRITNKFPFEGVQVTFTDGTDEVSADAVKYLTGERYISTPVASFSENRGMKQCRINITACTDCDGLVAVK